MATRKLGAAEQAAMVWLSGGSCYWPGCGVPAIIPVEGKYRMNVEIAHIRAFDDNGPRADLDMPAEQREAWTNKLLLCHPHHAEIDAAPGKYSVAKLEEWKTNREAGASGQLNALRVDESQLQDLITEVLAEQNERVNRTLERLEQSDAEAALVIRELRDQLDTVRQYGGILDIDAVSMLGEAAGKLEHLNLFDVAAKLNDDADKLVYLGDISATLSDAVDRIGNVGNSANMLARAASELPEIWDIVAALRAVVEELKRYGGNI